MTDEIIKEEKTTPTPGPDTTLEINTEAGTIPSEAGTISPKVEPEMVSISKADLDEVKEAVKAIKELKEENKRLTYAADKARLSIYDSNNKETQYSIVKVSYWKDKPVLAWSMIKDEIIENAVTGILKAEQTMRLFIITLKS